MTAVQVGVAPQTLSELCEINPPKPNLRSLPDDTPVLFVPMAAVDEVTGTITDPQVRMLGEVRNKSYRTFAPGDVLFAKITPCMENGKSAIVPPIASGIGFGSTEFHVLRPRNGTDPRLIWHFVRQEALRREARENMTGSVGQARVPAHFLNAIHVQLPDKDIQNEIADLLDAITCSTLSAKEHLAHGRASLGRFRQAVLATACSGRLTADWREQNVPRETAKQLISHSYEKVRQTSKKKTIEPWTEPDWIDLPETWCWAQLSDLACIQGGIQKQPKRTPKSNAYPYLRVANVGRGRLDLTEIHQFELFNGELETYRLEPGDLLVVEGNGSASEIGRAAIWHGEIPDCVHQNHIIRVRAVAMLPEFIELFWNSPVGAREIGSLAVTSAGLYSLSTKKIGSVPVPVAPLEEQVEIVRRVDQLIRHADAISKSVEQASSRVDRTAQGVLAKAFEGSLASIGLRNA